MPLERNFLEPFLLGTEEALRVTCNVEVQSSPHFMKGEQKQPQFHIGAILGITSTGFVGTISIFFTEDVYKSVIGGWLGEKIETLTQDHLDGAAELLNMIYGSAKVIWNEQGRSIQKAIPTVVLGAGFQTNQKIPVMVVPFKTAFGSFYVEICSENLATTKAG